MEAVITQQDFYSGKPFKEALAAFFKGHTPEETKVLFWKFLQCWVTRDCNLKADISDKDVALFFDQLIDLVAAAYIVHQADGAPENQAKGNGHE